jgi:Glycosyl transferases group 1
VRVITNGYDREAFDDPLPPPPDRAALEIVYAGAIYPGRDPRPLLDAVCQLRRNGALAGRPLRVSFFGLDHGSYDLSGAIRQRGLDGMVRIMGQIPHSEILRTLREADVLLLLDHPGRPLGVPAKLYEYIGAGRPILALGECGGDLEWVLRESGAAHRIADPSSPDAIEGALVALVGEARTGRDRPPADRRDRFTRERLTGALAGVLDELVGPGLPTG